MKFKELLKQDIEIIKNGFIPLSTKIELTNHVVDLCVELDEETNLYINDLLGQRLWTAIFKVMYLTNIELDEITEDPKSIDIDKIVENPELINKLLEIYDTLEFEGIMKIINSELINDDLDEIIEYKIKQKLDNHNSAYNGILTVFKQLPSMDEISNLATSLPNQLKDMKNLEILKPSNSKKKTSKPKTKKADKE